MTVDELQALFVADEPHGSFEDIIGKRSPYRDIHAMLLLAELCPREKACKMVDGATHDKIWFRADVEQLAAVATREVVVELRRCGVHWDGDNECLAMYV